MSKILQYDLEGNLINTFDTKQDIYKLGYQKDGLNRCLSEKKMTYKDYIWIWENRDISYIKTKIENIRKKLDPKFCEYCNNYFELPTSVDGTDHWRVSANIKSALKLLNPKNNKIEGFSLICSSQAADRERSIRRLKGLKKWPKIHQIDSHGNIIRTLDRAKDYIAYGFDLKSVSNRCCGYSKQHKGYYFKYENDPLLEETLKNIKKNQSNYCSQCQEIVITPKPGKSDEHWRWVPNPSYKEYITDDGVSVRGFHRCKLEGRAYINRFRDTKKVIENNNQKNLLLILNKYIYEGKQAYEKIIQDNNKIVEFENIYLITEDLSNFNIGDWVINKNELKQIKYSFYVYCYNKKIEEGKWVKLNNFLLNRIDIYKIDYKPGEKAERKIFRGNYSWYFTNKENFKNKCDSSYEAIFASYLLFNNISFKYHPMTYKSSLGINYEPDFYIIDENKYIEIKGLPNGIKEDNKQDKVIEEFKNKNNIEILYEKDIIKFCKLTVRNIQSYKYIAEKKGWLWEDYIVEMFKRGLQ